MPGPLSHKLSYILLNATEVGFSSVTEHSGMDATKSLVENVILPPHLHHPVPFMQPLKLNPLSLPSLAPRSLAFTRGKPPRLRPLPPPPSEWQWRSRRRTDGRTDRRRSRMLLALSPLGSRRAGEWRRPKSCSSLRRRRGQMEHVGARPSAPWDSLCRRPWPPLVISSQSLGRFFPPVVQVAQ